MEIAIAGAGYVGTSLGAMLSKKNKVTLFDTNKDLVQMLNQNQIPIDEINISKFIHDNKIQLRATNDPFLAFGSADYLIISTPTNFDDEKSYFDTSSIEITIKKALKINKKIKIVIKSTIPIGFTENMRLKFKYKDIYFSPEFLREGRALEDNLYPSRIIVGDKEKVGETFSILLAESSLLETEKIPILLTDSRSAEAIKLFSNTYLAMRVSYFNEVDSFCENEKINSKEVIDGISYDSRIGSQYNNPSFGYGGYCLPKDTKQLLSNFLNTPNSLITSIIESNLIRKKFIIDSILKKKPKVVGFYKLSMKTGSDNYRESAIIDVIDGVKKKCHEIFIYEPMIKDEKFLGIDVISDLNYFKKKCEIIIANRFDKDLEDVSEKLYTRDIYHEN